MNDFITIRIYFEFGQKIKAQSFWKKLYSNDFSTELMKRAKAFGLHHVLHLSVKKGYLNKQEIIWGTTEIRHAKHPHVIEIVDTEAKINQFLEQEKSLLNQLDIFIVRNKIEVK